MNDTLPNLLLMPEHIPGRCQWCQVVRRHLRKRQQNNFRKLLMGLLVAAGIAVLARTL